MTVANNYHKISYIGNGSTKEFSFDFPVLENSSIKVYVSIDGVETEADVSEYSANISGNGGSVIFNTAPADNTVIAITRLTDQTQETPYKTSSGFPAVRIEEAFDKLTMMIQEQQAVLERCVKVQVTDNQDPQELIDEVFDKLDLATVTGEAAIVAAKEANNAASSAQSSAEMAENVAVTAVSNINTAAEEAINEVKQQADKIDSKITAIEGVVGDIGFAPLGINEAQNKRRYLNGQVISQAQFESFTKKIKAAIELNSNLATSETNWQAEVTNSKLGQCGKFVIDDTLGTIRLPKVVNIQGLQDLSLLGGIKAESLPNITGNFTGGQNASGEGAWTGAFETTGGWGTVGGSSASMYKGDFNASRSSSTYQDNAPVQQEAIQYPYFIQVATGVEESVDVTREIELNNPFSLLDYKWSEYELSNASWLISNGAFHSGTTYVAVYELLLKLHSGAETKDGVSVKLSTEAYTDTDFVINTADTTFRLPIKTADDYVVENYDDGTNWYRVYKSGWIEQGGKSSDVTVNLLKPFANTGYTLLKSVIYNNTGSVLYNALGATASKTETYFKWTGTAGVNYWYACGQGAEIPHSRTYFYVGETIQDANVIAASQVLTTVADSVRKSSATDRETVVGWGMPDYSAEVDIKSSVVSVNGYTCVSSGQCFFRGNSNTNLTIIINGKTVMVSSVTTGFASGFAFNVDKGDVIKGNNVYSAQFFPLKGVN